MSDASKKDGSRPAPRKTARRDSDALAAAGVKREDTPAHNDVLSFESGLERLEQIVEELENGEIPLANLLLRYEEATGLLKTCQQQLDEAQLRVEKLVRAKDGSDPSLEPFTAADSDS